MINKRQYFTTNMTIYKSLIIKKFPVTVHLQKVSWETSAVHDGSPKSNYFNNHQKIVNWNIVKTTGAKVSSSKKKLYVFLYSWEVSE